jgi:protein-S-isoprenylcysteine O-methyltransferase Ste14
MDTLSKKAFAGLLRFVLVLAVILFLSAWTLRYWQGWIFLTVFSISCLLVTLDVRKRDPKLLERRLKSGPAAEKRPEQKIIQLVTFITFFALFLFPAIDYRFGWSTVSPYVVILGNVLVVIGFFIIAIVFRENTFTSAIVEVAANQTVISTGPYALVRHPMYLGAVVMLLGVPLALGSLWGLLLVIPVTLAIAWRLLDEEKFLAANLAGYSNYRNKVRYRLMPFVW